MEHNRRVHTCSSRKLGLQGRLAILQLGEPGLQAGVPSPVLDGAQHTLQAALHIGHIIRWCVHPSDRPQHDDPDQDEPTFSTAADNQGAVTIKVFQVEREIAADNKVFGKFDLSGVPAARRGMPHIEVRCDIDANGIVSVQEKDKATGKERQIRTQSSGGLPESDIKAMVRDADANAGAEKKRRAFVEAENQTDALVDQIQKSLAEQEGKVPAAVKTEAEAAVAAAGSAMEAAMKAH